MDATCRQDLRAQHDLEGGRVAAWIIQERRCRRCALLPSRRAVSIVLGLLGCTATAPPRTTPSSWPCANSTDIPQPNLVVPMNGRYELFVTTRNPTRVARPMASGILTFAPRDSVHRYARDAKGRRRTSSALPDYPFAGTGTMAASVFSLDHFSIPLSSTDSIYPGVLVVRTSSSGHTTIVLGGAHLLDASGAFLDLERTSGAGDTLAGTWTSSPGGARGVFCAIRIGP